MALQFSSIVISKNSVGRITGTINLTNEAGVDSLIPLTHETVVEILKRAQNDASKYATGICPTLQSTVDNLKAERHD